MEWLIDPTAWMGLLTLVFLEIVLGIDNLVFIAILADKVPPEQRDRARIIGLGCALVMRLVLLASISVIVHMTDPLIEVMGKSFSGRDFIMLAGGLFLLFKATMELHERLEGDLSNKDGPRIHAKFWSVVAQIIILDAVFSIDSVITAVGMTDHLAIMMIAVVIAVGIMMLASKPLTVFVNKHPTVIVLCLGFLLMIGFSLIAEGLGIHVPKGYLYAAIGFSILVEAFNQTARVKRHHALSSSRPLRERTAEAVLKLLGGRIEHPREGSEIADLVGSVPETQIFNPVERRMIRGVLGLSERSVKAIMTPRPDIVWIDVSASQEEIAGKLQGTSYSRLVVVEDGKIDTPIGIVQKKDLLGNLLGKKSLAIRDAIIQPPTFPESNTILSALETFKKEAIHLAFIIDEFGTFEGIVTLTDVTSAIAGMLPEEGVSDEEPNIIPGDHGAYLVAGWTDLDDLCRRMNIEKEEVEGDYHTAAGLALKEFGYIPEAGNKFTIDQWEVEVVRMDGQRIDQLRFIPIETFSDEQE